MLFPIRYNNIKSQYYRRPNYYNANPIYSMSYNNIPVTENNYGKFGNNTTNSNYSKINIPSNLSNPINNNNTNNSNKAKETNQNEKNINQIELLGLKFDFDDILIIALILFLYNEGVKDQWLFISLILLLLS